MDSSNKGKSPFYPGQPVPVEFFTGRKTEIERIARAIGQVEHGKPQAIFLTGEYGIGKSSLAGYMRRYAEATNHLLGIHAFLGGAQSLEDIAIKTVEAALKSDAYNQTTTEKVRNFLARYIGKQEFYGVNINLETLKADSPSISHGYLPFLRELHDKVKDSGIKGIMLILDEINGIANDPKFAHFIKALVDENALSKNPLPLLLILSGVEERRNEMIKNHQPIERIFDIVDIKPMADNETRDLFEKTFQEAGIVFATEPSNPINAITLISSGLPKIMQIIGDSIFWADTDGVIDQADALTGLDVALEDIGKKFIDKHLFDELRSKAYHSILKKLGTHNFDLSFRKNDIAKNLTEQEKKKFNNFLQRMKKLNVLESGTDMGEYIFKTRLIRLYILWNSLLKEANLR